MRPGRPHYLSTYLQHNTELTPNLHVTIAKFGQPACGRAKLVRTRWTYKSQAESLGFT